MRVTAVKRKEDIHKSHHDDQKVKKKRESNVKKTDSLDDLCKICCSLSLSLFSRVPHSQEIFTEFLLSFGF
jgi:hypothetical protein